MIQVNDDYTIELDAFNYTVKRDLHRVIKRHDKISGEDVEIQAIRTVGYYGTLVAALKAIIEDMNVVALSTGKHTLEEAVRTVKENNDKINAMLERALEV